MRTKDLTGKAIRYKKRLKTLADMPKHVQREYLELQGLPIPKKLITKKREK
jgi:hypothetical protein